MTSMGQRTSTSQSAGGTLVGITLVLSVVSASTPAAQPASSGRLNKIIEQFEMGEPAVGGEHWQINSLEHNPFLVDELEAFLNELEAAEAPRPRLTPIVRIPHEADQPFQHVVKQMLDAGAMGIVLPQVRTPDEVAKLVRAMRYPPQRGAPYPDPPGRRGWGPTAATRVWNVDVQEYARKADVWPLNPDGELLAIVMVETREIVDNIDEILQVPGLAGALVGPADLSLALGVGTPAANPSHPEVQAAIERVGAACRRHNRLCGIYSRVDIPARRTQGFMLFPIPPD
jgi:4-hydroxy-2-oxoheptanedioate aldolase